MAQRDKIRYVVRPGGEVVLQRAEAPEEDDPALGSILEFLAHDMANHPECLRPVDSGFVRRLRSLTEGVEVDLDAPLPPDEE